MHPIGTFQDPNVAVPDGEQGVYSAIGYAFDDPTAERTVQVDRFGGELVST